jgi:hypothetical protein
MQGDKKEVSILRNESSRLSHSSKNFNQDGTFWSIKEAAVVRNIQAYTNVSCRHKNVHMVHH